MRDKNRVIRQLSFATVPTATDGFAPSAAQRFMHVFKAASIMRTSGNARQWCNGFLLAGVVLVAVTWLTACGNKRADGGSNVQNVAATVDSATMVRLSYATGFKVTYLENGVRLVDITAPEGGKRKGKDVGKPTMKEKKGQGEAESGALGYRFALVPRGTKADVPEGYASVEVPIKSTICMTALQLSNFTILDAHDFVGGITGTKNLFNTDIRQRVKDGRIVKIGMEGNFDPEMIMAANPDVIFVSPFKRGGYDAIRETGIMLVPHLGYKELDPLGQAEWVKFVGMFIGKEREANEIFAGIERRYNELKEKVKSVATATRPTIFSGEMHYGNWHAVGGRNYLAQIFSDAGARYVIDDDETSGENLEFEKMYSLAAEAEYWRILNSYPGDFGYEALRASEPRNELFRAFKERKVIYCNMKKTPYYEISPVKPDLLLKDFVAIFHPDLVEPDYQPTFYRLLK